MPKERLPIINLTTQNELAHPNRLPELVHLDDPALSVMRDFRRQRPLIIDPDDYIDNALNEMKLMGAHLLLVVKDDSLVGLISSEDLLGEKLIKIIQQRRIQRDLIKIRMIMSPLSDLIALNIENLRHAKVIDIIKTLKAYRTHYALVAAIDEKTKKQIICGLFSSSQISRQLHKDITNSLSEAASLAELRERHT